MDTYGILWTTIEGVSVPASDYLSNLTKFSDINRDTKIVLTASYHATIFNAFGKLVEADIYRTVSYLGARSDPYSLDVDFDSNTYYPDDYIQPGEYQFTVSGATQDSTPDNIQWLVDGVEVSRGTTSFNYTLKNNKSVSIECYAEKYCVEIPDDGLWECYVRKSATGYWSLQALIEKAVPAIDYGRCAVPYDLGNGICLDLKTGDAKIYQTDLCLPGRNGLDLVLTRVFSGIANLKPVSNYSSYELFWGNVRFPCPQDL